MTKLRSLHLSNIELHDKFFSVMSELAYQSKVKFIYSVYQNKSLHFSQSHPYKIISTYFQDISIHVVSYMSLLSNDTKKI